jgi:hypothetical protein
VNERVGHPCHIVVALVAVISIPAQVGRSLVVGGLEVLVRSRHMATRTIAAVRNDPHMIPARRKECVGSMAVIARVGRLEADAVACWPPSGLAPVVAGRALPGYCRSMVEARPLEGVGVEVACFARGVGYDVTSRFGRRDNALSQCMTLVAIPWRTFEDSVDVATFAGRRSVPTVERKPGSSMIEIKDGRCFGRCRH